MMSAADPRVDSIVLPLVEAEIRNGEMALINFLGSGFLVDRSRRLITAKHVLQSADIGRIVAIRNYNGGWYSIALENIQFHPRADAAIAEVKIPDHPESWLQPTAEPQHQSYDCHVWGYPEDLLYDHGQVELDGRKLRRPEMVLTKAYIRRRVSYPIQTFQGSEFYELNEEAGAGCSGSPVIAIPTKLPWRVFGIYLGEVTTERSGRPTRARGYALRMEAIADWLRHIDPALIV